MNAELMGNLAVGVVGIVVGWFVKRFTPQKPAAPSQPTPVPVPTLPNLPAPAPVPGDPILTAVQQVLAMLTQQPGHPGLTQLVQLLLPLLAQKQAQQPAATPAPAAPQVMATEDVAKFFAAMQTQKYAETKAA